MPEYQRIILVTGSNTGIGFEIVRLLAQKGHIVYLSARNEAAGLEAQSKLKAEGLSTVKFVALDVTSAASIDAARAFIEKAGGRLDTLVHNAGVSCMDQSRGALAEPFSAIETTMATNFYGLISVSQAFVPLLRHAKPGYACIVSVASDMSSNGHMARTAGPLHGLVAYNSSKAAANSYLIALAKELAGEVKVNSISPGFTTTKLNGFRAGGKTAEQSAEVIVPWALLGADDKDKTCESLHLLAICR